VAKLRRTEKAGSLPAVVGPDETRALADLFHILGDQSRLSIMLACLDQPRPVGVLAELLGHSQSLVSHHLRLLKAARLVRAERRGRSVLYEADDEHVRTMLRDMVAHVREPAGPGR
jgi:DNA-binding transcriptional ArsR family regulator